ncbi:hypothetical protein [Roseateles chitosanitabidus]|uniref:hypothetical protein n=1 Tax=Roseateles chitosanitabidus TaxID=65048 RepID=UPI000830C520|nr:hypothetical protein [Roseateles chitosanitabidus]
MSSVTSSTGAGIPLIASQQLVSRPGGSFEINAREYGTVAAGAIGLAQAAVQGGENAVSAVVHWSEEGLQALEDGAKSLGSAVSTGMSEVKEVATDVKNAVVSGTGTALKELGDAGSTVAGYLAAGAAAGKALIDELT